MDRAASGIPPRARRPGPEAAAERQRVAPEILVEAASPERADQGIHPLADAGPADPDRPQADEPVVRGVGQGRAEEVGVERADRLGPEVRGHPLDLVAVGRDHEHDVRQREPIGRRLGVVAPAHVVLDRPPLRWLFDHEDTPVGGPRAKPEAAAGWQPGGDGKV